MQDEKTSDPRPATFVSVTRGYLELKQGEDVSSIRITEPPSILSLTVNDDGSFELFIVIYGNSLVFEGTKNLGYIRNSLMRMGTGEWCSVDWVEITNEPDTVGIVNGILEA